MEESTERDDTALFVLYKTGGETVEEIRRTKIKEAMKETLNVYEKLDLNMTEIEILKKSECSCESCDCKETA